MYVSWYLTPQPMSIDEPSTAMRNVPSGFSGATGSSCMPNALVTNGWPKSVRRMSGLSSNWRKSSSR